jgi:DNA polymerase-3 subunit epsilon
MKLFFFDLETTGVKFWKNGIHQISGCIEIDGEIKEEFNFKVQPNPKCEIEASALEVGNVTIEQIRAYDSMQKVFADLEIILSSYVDKFSKTDKFHLVGFNNASFDNPFFRAFFVQNAKSEKDAEYGNYFGSWFWSDSIDVMVLASNYLKEERHLIQDFKLKTVAKHLGIEVDETRLHDAKYDIYLTRELFNIVK